MPIIVMKDSKTEMVTAGVVPSKGVDPCAIGEVKKTTEKLGYKKAVLKSDNEPAILALRESVRKETGVELIMEESPVRDH